IEKRKVKVLFDTPFDEIKGICEDKEGNIFFSAARGVDRDRTGSKSSSFEPFLKSRKKAAKKPPPEKSILYCLHTNGLVDRVWASKEEYIYTAAYDKKDDSVLIGTGNFGRVYRVKEDGTFSIVYESESAQVFKIAGKSSGFTVISNNTAAIAQIEERLNNTGSYFSEVFDLEIQSKLGRLYWDASSQTKPAVTLSIRAGNSNIPDKTWNDWSAPFSQPENSTVNIQGMRYFQVKAVLNSLNSGKSPHLDNFRVYYMQSNLSPKVERIGIYKIKAKTVRPPDKKNEKKKEKKDKYLLVRWLAKDPNGDKLKYDIFLQKTGDSSWILVKENLTETKLELDTELFEDGKYLLKVEAGDSFANPPAAAKSHAKISNPFIIDSTAPFIEDFTLQRSQVNFSVKDLTSLIAKVLYSFDGELWYPIFPKDKINDSKTENFSFNFASHKQHRSLRAKKFIFIKVVDEFDNYKVFQREIK
ncbi:MAG: hypothetical protein KAW12_19835, partial [Candidatus Aminicenantes bacterium]|nr:hypothetical protein [Candidatus Aminicenantes bacterium]